MYTAPLRTTILDQSRLIHKFNNEIGKTLFFKPDIELLDGASIYDPTIIKKSIIINNNNNDNSVLNIRKLYLKIEKDEDYQKVIENIGDIIPETVDDLTISFLNECRLPVPVGLIPGHIKTLELWNHYKYSIGLQQGSIPSSVDKLAARYSIFRGDLKLIPDSVTELNLEECEFKNGKFAFEIPQSVKLLWLSLRRGSGPLDRDTIPSSVTNCYLQYNDADDILGNRTFPTGTIKTLELGPPYKQNIARGIIPDSVEQLIIKQPIDHDSLPMKGNLKYFSLWDYKLPAGCKLPNSITHLKLYNQTALSKGFVFPKKLVKLECRFNDIRKGSIPPVNELIFHGPIDFIEQRSIPSSVTKLIFTKLIAPKINLNVSVFQSVPKLEYFGVVIPDLMATDVKIPQSVKYLTVSGSNPLANIILPSKLEKLVLENGTEPKPPITLNEIIMILFISPSLSKIN
eukprot:gene10336-12690_t